MIEGVRIKKIIKHTDERGFFAELIKQGEETFHEVMQTSYSETHPGIIKGFHVHNYWEVWCVIKGEAKVVLHDMRPNSSTVGQTDIIFTGENDMMAIAIPGEVAHGYQPLDGKPMGIIYHASEAYNAENPTIRTIPYDSPDINFDWNASVK